MIDFTLTSNELLFIKLTFIKIVNEICNFCYSMERDTFYPLQMLKSMMPKPMQMFNIIRCCTLM